MWYFFLGVSEYLFDVLHPRKEFSFSKLLYMYMLTYDKLDMFVHNIHWYEPIQRMMHVH